MSLDYVLYTTAKLLVVFGQVYVVLKLINKARPPSKETFFTRNKSLLYNIHITGTKFAVLIGFVHGLMIDPIDQIYVITGWAFGITMAILLGIGAYMSIKTKSKPMTEEQDVQWKTLRIIKWVLIVVVVLLMMFHFLLYGWLNPA